MNPDKWQHVKKKQEGYGSGHPRTLHYIQSLRQPLRKLHNQPTLSHQTRSQYQPWSDVATKWTGERTNPLSRPRGFEFSMKVPFTDFSVQNKGSSSTTKGSGLGRDGSKDVGLYSQLYGPSSVQIYSTFNGPPGSGGFVDKGSTANGGKTAHEVSKPIFQLGLSVSVPPPTQSPSPSSSNQDRPTNPKKPESVNLVSVSPGHVSQHSALSERTSQVQISNAQTSVFPDPSAPSLPSPPHPPGQTYDVHRGYYSSQFNPLGNHHRQIQTGQATSSDPTNVHHSLFPSQSQSGHYSVGQVRPSSTNYAQHQTEQPSAPAIFTSEKPDYGQFYPSFHQNVEIVAPSPTVGPSQYEYPPFQQVATHYGTAYVAQMEPTDLSYHYQYGSDHSRRAALCDHLAVYDPSQNTQAISTDYRAQVGYPAQHGGGRQLEQPEYTKLFIDVDNVRDRAGGHEYFAAAPAHFNG